jgi:hypothetical protein
VLVVAAQMGSVCRLVTCAIEPRSVSLRDDDLGATTLRGFHPSDRFVRMPVTPKNPDGAHDIHDNKTWFTGSDC